MREAGSGVVTRNDAGVFGDEFFEEREVFVIDVFGFLDAELAGFVIFILGHGVGI